MEAYLYQHHQNFILDPAYDCSYDSPIEISMLSQYQNGGDLSNASSCFSGYNSSEAIQESSISLQQVSLDKKRKEIDDQSCFNFAQKKNTKELKSRKKKHNSVTILKEKLEGKKSNSKAKETKLAAKNTEEPPLGYIHVRARRGQATDSHSLAERVRRERISERMKKLQGLVPGCDNVIGKALVLDEIINYVQSLQNQVEFLSMKIASVNPILYDFGVGFEDYMSHVEEAGGMSQAIPSVIQTSHIQHTTFEGASNNIQVIDPSYMMQFHGQDSNTFSQDNSSSYLMQEELKNMCSFQ